LEEVTSTLLSNKISKRLNQEKREGSGLAITEEKEEEKKRKVWAYRRHVTFVTEKVIRRMMASIGKSG